jgi:hypothetical protein
VDHLQVVNHLRAADLLQVGNHPKAVGPHHPRAEHLLQADLPQVANHPKVADHHHQRVVDHHHKVNLKGKITSNKDLENFSFSN